MSDIGSHLGEMFEPQLLFKKERKEKKEKSW